MKRSRCSMGVASSQGIDQPPLVAQRKGVTHVPGLICYPCTRSVPRAGLTPRGTRSPAGSTIGTPSPKKNGTVHHPVVADTRLLLWMTNQNTITQHVWTSRIPRLNHPDLCVFDLDPSTDDPASIRAAAVSLRDLLSELGLRSWANTSGSRGFHIGAPLHRFIALVGHRSTNVIET